MMHLDAIKKRNRRAERQPSHEESVGFQFRALGARIQRNEMRAMHAARPVYVREV